MSIDVFTFVAQVFNFALLIYLLRRFLYKPVQDAMRRREETIATRLADAEREHHEAEQVANEYREQLEKLEAEREGMLAEARADADRLATQLSTSLKERMAEHERDWHDTQARRAEQDLSAFRDGVRDEVTSAIRAALADLADEELEAKMTTRFLRRVTELTDEEIHRLVPEDEERPRVEVVTTYPLDESAQRDITTQLRARMGDMTRISFDRDDSRIAGIELRCQGHRLGWSIADYLEQLDDGVRTQIHQLKQRADHAEPAR